MDFKTNPFVKIVNQNKPYLTDVVCSQYTPELQLSILELDIKSLKEPVIDIGCGTDANLVSFLRKNGINASGLDRTTPDAEWLIKDDWLSYNFLPLTWGTIIAHMSFSNHFVHHNLRKDGDFISYAKKYNQILSSLLPGGRFIYTPSLPFIEEHLPVGKYTIKTKSLPSNFAVTEILKVETQ